MEQPAGWLLQSFPLLQETPAPVVGHRGAAAHDAGPLHMVSQAHAFWQSTPALHAFCAVHFALHLPAPHWTRPPHVPCAVHHAVSDLAFPAWISPAQAFIRVQLATQVPLPQVSVP